MKHPKAQRTSGFAKSTYKARIYRNGQWIVDIPIAFQPYRNPKHSFSKATAFMLVVFELIRYPDSLGTLKRSLRVFDRAAVQAIRDVSNQFGLDNADTVVTGSLIGGPKRTRVYSHEPVGVKCDRTDTGLAEKVAIAN